MSAPADSERPGAQLCHVYRLRPGAEQEYERRHAEVWPELSALIDEAGIYDYHIYRYGLLLICVLRTRNGFGHASRVSAASQVQARWTRSLAHLFAEVADADGEPLWAYPVFDHPGHPPPSEGGPLRAPAGGGRAAGRGGDLRPTWQRDVPRLDH
ncbi:L-rhamnose mutarotase [Solwaraspora sp. WMMD937]|uniref:L-rhamnose mutarotase n=1 Tax=Solwaraspora sp. WMMD937 TaxID=3016090 RepID=UPI002499D799|nr:L-rhamnose mutarotase [Solwaraspora sp. WMMD937]WFE23214.1 L-rhamnose mutarotase [Solwaraspora sp. WMMD937]